MSAYELCFPLRTLREKKCFTQSRKERQERRYPFVKKEGFKVIEFVSPQEL